MKFFQFVFTTSCLLMLAACTNTPSKQAPAVKPTVDRENRAATVATTCQPNSPWLEYIKTFNELSTEAQRKELALLNNSSDKSRINRGKLAIAYALPSSRVRDPIKAQVLLDELVLDKTLASEEKNLFGMLRDFTQDSTRSASRLKDEQKRADTAQAAAAVLQKKLDDLKNIEKAMIDRDQGSRK